MKDKRRLWIKHLHMLPLVVSILGILYSGVEYIMSPRGNYSYGPGVYCLYICVVIYIIFILYYLVRYWNCIMKMKRNSMCNSVILIVLFFGIQVIFPYALTSCLGITLVFLCIYEAIENPGEYVEKESGVYNRFGFARILDDRLEENRPFIVLDIILEDWDSAEGNLEQQYRCDGNGRRAAKD